MQLNQFVLSLLLLVSCIGCSEVDGEDGLVVKPEILEPVSDVEPEDPDPRLTLVYGPGLSPKLVYPARYFFIQAVHSSGKNFSRSPHGNFTVGIAGIDQPCRVWTQVLDRHDGSFIVRYRIYEQCNDIRIVVRYGKTDVGQSPYTLQGPIYQEECYCPEPDFASWLDSMSCPPVYQQIADDLSIFHGIDMNSVLNSTLNRFNLAGSYSWCNYVILNNEVYRKCYGQHVGFKMFADNILLSLARKVVLPDMEFLVNLGDWPLEKKTADEGAIPILSWCGSEDTRDIVMPTYDITEATLETMGRVMLDMMSVQSSGSVIPWELKKPRGFWRGRDSRRERLYLVYLARQNPSLFNASLTNFFFFPELESEYGPKKPYVSFFDFFRYKYQINIDGTVAAYRMPYLLAGNGLVLKQDSKFYEHFYHDLEPMKHFVPFKSDLSDLVDKVRWAQSNDRLARQIGKNGRKFAQENLMPKDIFCYHAVLFHHYSARLLNDIRVREGMDHVEQPYSEKSHCTCHRIKQMHPFQHEEL